MDMMPGAFPTGHQWQSAAVGEHHVLSPPLTREHHALRVQAVNDGVLKVMAKMGVSTIASYKGSQLFEALGLADDVVKACFVGTASRIGGVSFDGLAADLLLLHADAYGRLADLKHMLPDPGEYQFRSTEGHEVHLNSPLAMSKLQVRSQQPQQPATDSAASEAAAAAAAQGLPVEPRVTTAFHSVPPAGGGTHRQRGSIRGVLQAHA
jgi:glutamate synthase (NADPH/NADH)